MPSKLPRTYLTLPWPLAESLTELADAMDKPVPTVIVELLNEIRPQVDGLAKLVRHARAGNKAAAKRTLQHMIGDGMAEIIAQQMELPAVPKRKKQK